MTDMIAWMVSSSVLILLVIVLRRLLRGRISLRLQYALWLLVLVRLLIPGTVGESAISVQRPLDTAEARISETPLPDNWAVVVVQPGVPAFLRRWNRVPGQAPVLHPPWERCSSPWDSC